MSAGVDGVSLSVVDSSLLTDCIIFKSLSEHESECKESTKFCGVFIQWNEPPSNVFLFTKTFSLTSSFNILAQQRLCQC